MIIIGVGGLETSNTAGECLKTFALGSCVAVICIHPPTKTVGMVHIALWNSGINRQKALSSPGFFADTGIIALMRSMKARGISTSSIRKQGFVKIAGGANVMGPHDAFKIGQRNADAIKRILASLRIPIGASDIGSQISRTVCVHVDSGAVVLSSPGKKDWQL